VHELQVAADAEVLARAGEEHRADVVALVEALGGIAERVMTAGLSALPASGRLSVRYATRSRISRVTDSFMAPAPPFRSRRGRRSACSASAACSSGSRAPTNGRTWPAAISLSSSAATSPISCGRLPMYAPPARADDAMLLSSRPVDLDLRDRAAGEADTTSRPSGFSERRLSVKRSPPTGSPINSAPRVP
jgi:hypothetical protein